jgi:nitroimidazol reductase NimA-like FMN-containing flavoprotein (pyridoxamine 5'-phosphate oxidase superfamily)
MAQRFRRSDATAMSAPPRNPVGRAELALSDRGAPEHLRAGWSGHLATVGADGWPYVVPYADDAIYMHHARHDGHLASNLAADARACFSVDEPGEVYAYGRFECDS